MACAAPAQAFGRFGYTLFPEVPGLDISAEGFRARTPGADRFRFESANEFKAQALSDRSVTYVGPERDLTPQKLRVNLNGPGFELYFPKGVRLRVGSLLGPLLTVADATYGPDTPTPKTKQVLVTFRDPQPPVLLVFFGEAPALQVTGRSGDWVIDTDQPYKGWMRACLPLGLRDIPTNSAAALGQLAQELRKHEQFWWNPAPNITGFELRAADDAVTAFWKFDAARALVPPPVLGARGGGYGAQVLTPLANVRADVGFGPPVYTTAPELAVRFPALRVPGGRALVWRPTDPAVSGGLPPPVEAALANLFADSSVGAGGRRALESFLAEAAYTREPWTNQLHPFDAEGAGAEAAAQHALLMQSLRNSGSSSDPNALFTSLVWRRDWLTWLVWAKDEDAGVRASAYAAVAGALSGESEMRLDAAMLQAGLATWERRAKPASLPPLAYLRRALFVTPPNGVARALRSPVRVASAHAVALRQDDGKWVISWTHGPDTPRTLNLLSAYPLFVTARRNLQAVQVSRAFGVTSLRYSPKEDGLCEMTLGMPKWADPPPPYDPAIGDPVSPQSKG